MKIGIMLLCIIFLIIFIDQSFSKSFESIKKHRLHGKDRTYNQLQNTKNLKSLKTKFQLEFSGFIQTRFTVHDNYKNSFELKRTRFIIKSELNKKFSFKLQSELSGTRLKLLDAEMVYALNNLFRICIGQFKIPLSMENMTSSSRLLTLNWSQNVDALVSRSKDVIGNQSGRDIGMKFSGKLNKNQNSSTLEYAIGIFNGSGINSSESNNHKDVSCRIIIFPVTYFSLGGSFYKGKYTEENSTNHVQTRDRIGAEFKYDDNTYTILSEYIMAKDSTIQRTGWYFIAAAFVFPEKLQFVMKYDVFDPDLNISKNINSIYTIGSNFFIDKNAKIQIHYEYKKEELSDTNDNILYAQFQIQF